nr:MAG TPA: hypothetical protein [Caudoviricetes sp.]
MSIRRLAENSATKGWHVGVRFPFSAPPPHHIGWWRGLFHAQPR